jgi:hypothetical protein
LSGTLRAVLLLVVLAVGQATMPAAALPLRSVTFDRTGPSGLLVHASVTDPLALPGPDSSIRTIEGPPLDNVPEPDTLAILGGAIAAFAVVTLARRNRRK